MSNVKLAGNVSGTGSVTIASPNTNSDISISLPTVTGGSFVVSDSSGNVGIGTSSPSTKFTVSGNANLTGNFYTPDYGYIGNSAGTFSGINTGFQTLSGGSGYLLAFTNGNERMRIDSSGNVGIGKTPSQKLDVAGRGDFTIGSPGIIQNWNDTSSNNIQVGTTTDGLYISNTANKAIWFATNSTEQARITSTGLFQFNSGYGSVATAYGCRAWVNFNGQGTVAIRASGNVSSITDNGTGDYTVNFTTAMPDANYSPNVSISGDVGFTPQVVAVNNKSAGGYANVTPTTSAFRLTVGRATDGSPIDALYALVSVFR